MKWGSAAIVLVLVPALLNLAFNLDVPVNGVPPYRQTIKYVEQVKALLARYPYALKQD